MCLLIHYAHCVVQILAHVKFLENIDSINRLCHINSRVLKYALSQSKIKRFLKLIQELFTVNWRLEICVNNYS